MGYDIINKIIIGAVAIIFFLAIGCVGGSLDTYYTREGRVSEINTQSQEVVITDNVGNDWVIIDDGFKVGDEVLMKMDNNHTDSVKDDEIVKIKKK